MLNTERYLLALVMGFSFMTTSVVAQEEESDVEEVVVTGSRIATSEFTGAQPVVVLDQEVIARTAELTISDVLREMPINVAGSFYERSGSSAGGTSTISLRGLGSSRTLVLIDGRRVPANPKTGGESANLNLLPTAAIERVEILADGASAVYGSDAIGGVVTLSLKKTLTVLLSVVLFHLLIYLVVKRSHSLLLADYQLMILELCGLMSTNKEISSIYQIDHILWEHLLQMEI